MFKSLVSALTLFALLAVPTASHAVETAVLDFDDKGTLPLAGDTYNSATSAFNLTGGSVAGTADSAFQIHGAANTAVLPDFVADHPVLTAFTGVLVLLLLLFAVIVGLRRRRRAAARRPSPTPRAPSPDRPAPLPALSIDSFAPLPLRSEDRFFKRPVSSPSAPRTRQNSGRTQRPTRLNLSLDGG